MEGTGRFPDCDEGHGAHIPGAHDRGLSPLLRDGAHQTEEPFYLKLLLEQLVFEELWRRAYTLPVLLRYGFARLGYGMIAFFWPRAS